MIRPALLAEVTLALMTAIGIYACYRLAVPFLPALTWAIALTILFSPAQRWLARKVLRPSLAAFACVAFIGAIVVVPVSFVGQQL